MTGYFILLALLLGIVFGTVVAFRRRKRGERPSGIHPEDQPPTPRVKE